MRPHIANLRQEYGFYVGIKMIVKIAHIKYSNNPWLILLSVIAKLLQVTRHLLLHAGQFSFQLGYFNLHGIDVDFLLLLKGIHIARNIEVKIVVLDFLEACQIDVFINGLPPSLAW